MRAVERAYWQHVLEQAGGNVSEAARLAGVHRSWAHARLRLYGIHKPEMAHRRRTTDVIADALRKFLR